MRKRRWMPYVLCLVLLIPAILRARAMLPLDSRALIEAKYGGWTGVLRLWVCEGWQPGSGSAAGWLNRCIAAFEKAHPGVYVQPEYVEPAAMADIGANGILPPDMALFPPGLLNDPGVLEPLTVPLPVREGFRDCGRVGEAVCAAPVMAGGYLWARNAALLDAVPGNWRAAKAALSSPPDEPFRQWGAALLALCSARSGDAAPMAGFAGEPAGEVDLGLPAGGATPAPAAAPAPESGAQDCELPEGFAFDGDAWRRFVNGELAAIPVTQREIARLQALSDRGLGVDWRTEASGAGVFTDQLLCIGVVRRPKGGTDARRGLCEAFVGHLLGDACQGELYRAGAFSVTDAPSGYGAGDALASMDAALRGSAPVVPNCFDQDWRRDAEAIVRKFIAGDAAPAPLWAQLAARLSQKPEH